WLCICVQQRWPLSISRFLAAQTKIRRCLWGSRLDDPRSATLRAKLNVSRWRESRNAERCLGHVIGGVRETYDRHAYHTEKLQAWEAVAEQIERIVNPPQGDVVQLRGWR